MSQPSYSRPIYRSKLLWPVLLILMGIIFGAGLSNVFPATVGPYIPDSEFYALGSLIGMLASWLGLGGSILLVPALLNLPGSPLSAHQITGTGAVQSMVTALMGFLSYRHQNLVQWSISWRMALFGSLGAALGAIVSTHLHGSGIGLAFSGVSLLAALSLIFPKQLRVPIKAGNALYGVTLLIGIMGGITGTPGAFILTPMMLVFTGLPLKQCLGTVLGPVFLMALVSAGIKLHAHQIAWTPTLMLLAGGVPAAWVGPQLATITPTQWLRFGLITAILGATALTIAHTV